MPNPVAVYHKVARHKDEVRLGGAVLIWCPGCDQLHRICVVGEDGSHPECHVWDWDRNLESPTFSPSLLCYGSAKPISCTEDHPHYDACLYRYGEGCSQTSHLVVDPDTGLYGHVKPCPTGPNGNCHSFIKRGYWEFLSDSAHKLAGQMVAMVPLPDWVVK